MYTSLVELAPLLVYLAKFYCKVYLARDWFLVYLSKCLLHCVSLLVLGSLLVYLTMCIL